PTPVGTVTSTTTSTPRLTTTTTPTIMRTLTRTITPTATSTATSAATLCPMTFSDVHPSDFFYEAVRYLFCRGVISGYSDGTFRPYNNATRGQLSKMVVLAEGWRLDCPQQHFTDVPSGNPFFCFVETAYSHNIIS